VRLDGRTVVVTRAGGGEDALSARLGALGAAIRALPAIATAPPVDLAPLDAALRALPRFDWVAFASATAVERVAARIAELGLSPGALSARRLAAVGPATAARLAAAVRPPDLVPAEASGEALARSLAPHVAGKTVLLPRAAEGRPELLGGLREAGSAVTPVEAYRTIAAPPETLRHLAGWLAAGEVDAIAFASPSAVHAVVAALGGDRALLASALLAAIGPTTARALRELGLVPGVEPTRHTAWDLADAIAARLGPR
jgi:uroporphyrinogen-III synthase/uroporphyrinogen III methyltransferase/synthase